MKTKRTMYAIYLPRDNEKWFRISFSKKDRAHWFAERSGLNPEEYEVRNTNEKVA